MKYIKAILLLSVVFILNGCQENRVNRLLPGSWKVLKHTVTDQFGFIEECSGDGTLELGNCKKNDCSMQFDFTSSCSNTNYSWSESGTYQTVEKGADLLFSRVNIDQTIDTIKYHIYLVTSSDLKVDFYDKDSGVAHLFVMARN